MTINIKDLVGVELDSILKDFSTKEFQNDFLYRGFLCSDNITTRRILYIGLNPSFQKGNELYNDVKYLPEVKLVENDYKIYFGRFEKLYNKAKDREWTHIDLLYCRETSQKVVENFGNQYPEFINRQLAESKKIIEETSPKIIVVANALACKYFSENKNLYRDNMKFDDEIGTYRITEQASKNFNTPVFFTGMISGQRALDNGSFQRLEWHITQVLKKLSK